MMISIMFNYQLGGAANPLSFNLIRRRQVDTWAMVVALVSLQRMDLLRMIPSGRKNRVDIQVPRIFCDFKIHRRWCVYTLRIFCVVCGHRYLDSVCTKLLTHRLASYSKQLRASHWTALRAFFGSKRQNTLSAQPLFGIETNE